MTSTDVSALFGHVLHQASQRKLRLFLLTVCNSLLGPDDPLSFVVPLGERLADGSVDPVEIAAGQTRVWKEAPVEVLGPAWLLLHHDIPNQFLTWQDGTTFQAADGTAASQCLRDIFGNPFRPVMFDHQWRTTEVVDLARAFYDDRAFDRMPVLADALMDARCSDEGIPAHCRSAGSHVRGCWVVDLVLGRE